MGIDDNSVTLRFFCGLFEIFLSNYSLDFFCLGILGLGVCYGSIEIFCFFWRFSSMERVGIKSFKSRLFLGV